MYFLRGAAPKKIVQWKEPKAHGFNWCLEQRNGIFVLYPSSISGSFQLLSPFYVDHFPFDFDMCTGQYAVCLILMSNAALSMSMTSLYDVDLHTFTSLGSI